MVRPIAHGGVEHRIFASRIGAVLVVVGLLSYREEAVRGVFLKSTCFTGRFMLTGEHDLRRLVVAAAPLLPFPLAGLTRGSSAFRLPVLLGMVVPLSMRELAIL
jgi:hypothetical protein